MVRAAVGIAAEIVYRAGKEQVVSDILSRHPSEPQFLSQQHFTKVSQFLRKFVPQYTISSVSASAVAAISEWKTLAYLACLHYCMAYLDTSPPVDERSYGNCSQSWKESRYIWGNPLSAFSVQLKGKQLAVAGDAQFSAPASLTVETSFLAQIFVGQSSSADKNMARLYARGHSADATFVLCQAGEFFLQYHIDQNGSLQLAILGSRGLHKLAMNELHRSAISAHLEARKTIWDFYCIFGGLIWPRKQLFLHVRVILFSMLKVALLYKPIGLLALLSIPSSKFEQWTMEFVGPLS